jgi:hypothetical protein
MAFVGGCSARCPSLFLLAGAEGGGVSDASQYPCIGAAGFVNSNTECPSPSYRRAPSKRLPVQRADEHET